MIFYVLCATATISWTGLVLAQCGIFSMTRLWVCCSLIGGVAFALLKSRLPASGPIRRPSRSGMFLGTLLLLCIFLYFRPHEYVLARWDPGTYVNSGAHIARTGSITMQDPLFAEMSPKEIELFTPLKAGAIRHPGFYFQQPLAGTIVPQFYHVYPVWIAVFFKLFGAHGSLFVNPLFAILALWTMWHLAQALFGTKSSALYSCILMGLSVIQIWNARFPTSEILAQYFILSGLVAFVLFESGSKNVFGLLAGVSFSLALLTRPTAVLILPCIALYFLACRWGRLEKKDLAFLVPLAAGLVHLWLQGQWFTRYYVGSLPSFFSSAEKIVYGWSGAATALVLALAAIFKNQVQGFLIRKPAWVKGTRIAASLGLVLACVYGYWIRPGMGTGQECQNLVNLIWFTGPLVFILAVAGAVSWLNERFRKEHAPAMLLGAAETAFFLYKKRTYSSYPWALKRYTPVVMPALALCAGLALDRIGGRSGKALKILAAMLCAVSVLLPYRMGYRFIVNTDHKGIVAYLAGVAERMDEDALYLFDRDWLAVPLQQMFDRQVLVLPRPERVPEFEKVLLRWLGSGRRIYYAGTRERPYSLTLNYRRMSEFFPPFSARYLESSFGSYPQRIREIRIAPVFYRVEPLAEIPRSEVMDRIVQIGQNSIGLLQGFDKARLFRDPGKTYRWTTERSTLALDMAVRPGLRSLELRVKNPKPAAAGPTRLDIRLNGIRAGVLLIPRLERLKTFTLELDPHRFAHIALERVELTCDAWNPKAAGISGDDRNLGVILDWIRATGADGKLLKHIEIGSEEGVRVTGFHDPEADPQARFWGRWTRGKAELVIPWTDSDNPLRIMIRAGGFRKAAPGASDPLEPARITLRLNDHVVAQDIVLPYGMKTLDVKIPPGTLPKGTGRAVLSLESTTWSPARAGIKGFPGRLGVLVDWIRIRSS